MDYQKAWEALKKHYADKQERFEQQGREDSMHYAHARSVVDIMDYLEYEQEKSN